MEIKVLQNILNANDQIAARNRELLERHQVFTVNLMASPGGGKTTLILATVAALKGRARVGVIEGDISSSIDTERLQAAGITALQINTGGECHLDASMVNLALAELPLEELDFLFIENVGNLICPAGFDLGEALKAVVLSTPEGDDKPYKYPGLFTIAGAMVVTKIDLLPHLDFSLDAFRKALQGMNPAALIYPLAAITGDGVAVWADRLLEMRRRKYNASGS